MKILVYVLLTVVGIMLLLLAFPQSCSKKLDKLETRKDKSLVIDSIISEQTRKHNAVLDSIIYVKKKTDSIQKVNILVLQSKYNALRLIVRQLKPATIDSLTKVVNGVPVDAYNASINSGVMCDELLADKDESLNRKDSIISMREIQIGNDNKEIAAKEQAVQDLIALDEQKGKKLKHAKSLNKKIPLIAGIAATLGFLLAIFALK